MRTIPTLIVLNLMALLSAIAIPAFAQVNINTNTGATLDAGGVDGDVTTKVEGAVKMGKPLKLNGESSTMMKWSNENEYWRNEYRSRPYYSSSTNYSTYAPAYQFGFDSYNELGGKRYDELDQNQLKARWESRRGNSGLSWDQAQAATRDAYERAYNNRINATTSGSATVR